MWLLIYGCVIKRTSGSYMDVQLQSRLNMYLLINVLTKSKSLLINVALASCSENKLGI